MLKMILDVWTGLESVLVDGGDGDDFRISFGRERKGGVIIPTGQIIFVRIMCGSGICPSQV